jgi:hypothetical protein
MLVGVSCDNISLLGLSPPRRFLLVSSTLTFQDLHPRPRQTFCVSARQPTPGAGVSSFSPSSGISDCPGAPSRACSCSTFDSGDWDDLNAVFTVEDDSDFDLFVASSPVDVDAEFALNPDLMIPPPPPLSPESVSSISSESTLSDYTPVPLQRGGRVLVDAPPGILPDTVVEGRRLRRAYTLWYAAPPPFVCVPPPLLSSS